MSKISLSLEAFREGDPSSFKDVFHLFNEPIFLFVSKLINDHAEAQDITVETFEKLWRLHSRFENLTNIKAFLFVTSRNACIDYFRRKKRHKELTDHMQYLFHDDDPKIELSAEVLAILYKALETLPPQPRKILTMFFEGLTSIEIADILGISTHNVNVQKGIGIKRLREVLRNL